MVLLIEKVGRAVLSKTDRIEVMLNPTRQWPALSQPVNITFCCQYGKIVALFVAAAVIVVTNRSYGVTLGLLPLNMTSRL